MYTLLVVVDLVLPGGFDTAHRGEVVWLGVVFVAAPVAIATLIATITHQLRPLRLFMPEHRGGLGPTRFGFLLAMVSMILIPFALILVQRWNLEAWVPGSITAVVTLLAFRFVARRCMPGHCTHCGYDIHRSLEANRCPECGRGLMGRDATVASG